MRQLVWSMIAGGTAFLFGSGWYLAEKIRSEALAVGPGPAMPAYDDVQVVGLSPEKVQLRAVGGQAALFKPQLYGIAWPGGTGHLGAGALTRPRLSCPNSARILQPDP